MRILYLSPRQAWPPRSGAKLRDFHLARALGRRADLTYVFYADPGAAIPGPADFPFCRRLIAVPKPRAYTPAKIVRGLFGRWPLSVVNYTSPEMESAIEDVSNGKPFDIVHVDSIHLLACAPEGARLVYDWHNMESEIMRRYSEHTTNLLKKFYAGITARKLASAEAFILKSAFGHVVCSERERALLAAQALNARIELIENGVDTAAFEETARAVRPRTRIVFVAQMDNHANLDAAVFFARRIWPGIHQRFPEWRLTLVGADPLPEVRALAAEPAVEVTGTVPDVRPYYEEALAAVVPLRTGSGTRLKVLEAMAAGVPVVSSPLGAEGLDVSPGENILIAPTDSDWLPALASLDVVRDRLVAAGHELVRARYDWEMIGEKLYQTYRRWSAAPR